MDNDFIILGNNPVDIRKEHLKHEVSVQSIGILYYIGALFLFMEAIAEFLSDGETSLIMRFGVVCLLWSFCIIYVLVGTGLRRLRPWARIPTVILSCIGLLGYPVGTLINGFILYLVLSKQGGVVFSKEYKSVIAATPEIKYQTPKIVWVLFWLLIAILGILVVSIAF